MQSQKEITVVIDIKDQKVAKEITEAVSTLKNFSITQQQINLENSGNYDILFLEIGNGQKKELQLVQELKASGINRDVFYTSSNKDPEILIEAIRTGIKGFFPQPINKDQVRNAMMEIMREKEDKEGVHQGEIITVFGSKGGVGTTTLAANLAVSLATTENSPTVALIDMKPIFGEISMLLNVDTHFSWIDVTNNISRLDTTYLMSVLTKHSTGVYVLPSPVELSDDHANNPHPHALATLMRLMQTIFDFIIVDNGQSFDDTSREIMKTSGAVLLVSELSLPCIINVKRLLDTFKRCGFPEDEKIGIVLNRYEKNSEISIKEAGKSINKKIMFSIPNEYAIAINAINQGKPFCEWPHVTEISKKYKELANIFLVSDKEKRSKKKSFSLSSFLNRS